MKNLLLTLATAALMVSTTKAQSVISSDHAACLPNKISMPTRTVTPNKGKKLSTIKKSVSKVSNIVGSTLKRDAKTLGYMVGDSILDSLDYYACSSYNFFNELNYRIGYWQCFHTDFLRRFVGNRLSKIKFVVGDGIYSDAEVRIYDDKSYDFSTSKYTKVLWQKDITITPNALNEVDCDLPIPDDEEFLDHGIAVVFYAKVEADTTKVYDEDDPARDFFVAVVYDDHAVVEHNSAIIVHNMNDDTYGYTEDLGERPHKRNPAIWIETEGDAGLNTEDVMPITSVKVRGIAGTKRRVEGSFANMGTDSVRSVDYICENDGRTLAGTVYLDKPVKLLTEGKFYFDLPLSASAGTFDNGKLTITKVNGKDDEYAADNELTGIKSISLTEAYKRTPVLEEITSTSNHWNSYGIIGAKKALDAVNGKAVVISVHYDYGSYDFYDPLVSSSYEKFYDGFVTTTREILGYSYYFVPEYRSPTIVNREKINHSYNGIDNAVKDITERPCEASITLTPTKTAKGIQLNTKLHFTVDAPAGRYGLAYVVKEDNIENVAQENIFSTYYHNYVNTEDPNPEMVEWYNNLDDAEKSLATAERFPFDENTDVSYFTMNNVACDLYDPLFTDSAEIRNQLILPAITAGVDRAYTFVVSQPTREADPEKTYGSPVPAVKPENLKYVVFLIDFDTNTILTGCQAALGETGASDEKFDITGINTVNADAAADIADISTADGAFTVKANGAVAQVYDAQGRLVSSGTVNGVASLPTFGRGVFVVRVTKNGHSVSKKATF